MTVYIEKDETGDKENKVGKKSIAYPDRGKAVNYALTQQQNWWTDNKSGVFFAFGTDEQAPWMWKEELNRPVLFWEIIPFDESKIANAETQPIEERKNESTNNNEPKLPEKTTYFPYCGFHVMEEDSPRKAPWYEAKNSAPQGWRLPTVEELQCMCHNKTLIKGFTGKEYWSNEKDKKDRCLSVTTNDCDREKNDETDEYSVRYVKDHQIDWENPDYIHFTIRERIIEVVIRDLPQQLTWYEACKSCPDGWRLPTAEELQKMCENKNRIPMFNERRYWSSTEKNETDAKNVTTNDCNIENGSKSSTYPVRCVRNK
jgi:hypothetical protein